MYNFLFPFLFSSSSPCISLSLLVFLHPLASSFAAAAKVSPSSSPASLSLFFPHIQLQPNKLAMMPGEERSKRQHQLFHPRIDSNDTGAVDNDTGKDRPHLRAQPPQARVGDGGGRGGNSAQAGASGKGV